MARGEDRSRRVAGEQTVRKQSSEAARKGAQATDRSESQRAKRTAAPTRKADVSSKQRAIARAQEQKEQAQIEPRSNKRDAAGANAALSARQKQAQQSKTGQQLTGQQLTRSHTNTASGGEAKQARLSEDQRARVRQGIRQSIGQQQVRPLTRVKFPISVGKRIPRTTHLYLLPAAVIAIAPFYSGYQYFLVDDSICIVEPDTYEIVDVIERSPIGPSDQVAALTLTHSERQLVLVGINMNDARVNIRLRLALGAEIPEGVSLREFPLELVEAIPQLEPYRYVVAGNDVVIVDPTNREIVLVIRG